MVELPDNYMEFRVVIAVPNTITSRQLSRILNKASYDMARHFPELAVNGPTVMAIRDDNGVLVGALTKI